MSKENTKKFLDDVRADADLRSTLLDSNAQTWISSAKSKGLDFTSEELADELIVAIRGVINGELSDGSLDEVSGGAGVNAAVAQRQVKIAPNLQAGVKVAPLGGAKLPGKGAARW